MVADPEVSCTQLGPQHSFLLVASDGVWEFISSQAAVDLVGVRSRGWLGGGVSCGGRRDGQALHCLSANLLPAAPSALQVSQHTSATSAAKALVATAYKLWLQRETRTDDITCLVAFFDWPSSPSSQEEAQLQHQQQSSLSGSVVR